MRRLILILALVPICLVALTTNCLGSFDTYKNEVLDKLHIPKIGEQITVIRREGGEFTGQISAITSDTVTIGDTTYSSWQLTSASRDKVFVEQYARRIAREHVVDERSKNIVQYLAQERHAERIKLQRIEMEKRVEQIVCIGLVIAFIIGAIIVTRKRKKRGFLKVKEEMKFVAQREKDFIENLKHVIDYHIKVLARKKSQLTFVDDYGYKRLDENKWEREVTNFIDNVAKVEIEFEDYEYDLGDDFYGLIDFLELIENRIDNYEISNENLIIEFNDKMDGIDYEHFCSDLFKQNKWSTSVTKSSGDQGADIIAKKDNFISVVQCKKYNSPVGNKAVQEIYSAKEFYGADLAIVVTNSSFTQSAKTLALKLRVQLIHHDEISDIILTTTR